jgi:hypothetical protein
MFNFFFPENRAVYKIMWKNMAQPDRPQITIWRIRCTYWMTKATDTYSEYVIFIIFHRSNVYANGHQYYVIHTLPVLLIS